jgi:hypothetical protein
MKISMSIPGYALCRRIAERMAGMISRSSAAVQERGSDFPVVVLLVVLCLAECGLALSMIPSSADDLILLSSVLKTHNPLSFFASDWGLGNYAYRPLHSVTLWTICQFAGVWAFPQQLLNLLLHLGVILLLLRVISRLQPDRMLSFLLAAVALVSLHTVSPTCWASDRPTAFVAIFFLLTLGHLLNAERLGTQVRVSYVTMLSILALMSKESGLVVPLFVLAYVVLQRPRSSSIVPLMVACVLTVAGYMALRFMIFGAKSAAYSESGKLLGIIAYDDWSGLAPRFRFLALVDNVGKNALAVFVPIFDGLGGFSKPAQLLTHIGIWLPTVAIICLSLGKRLSPVQKLAVLVIGINAVLHYAVFRYRVLYVPQLAFCMFVAATPMRGLSPRRDLAVKLLAAILLMFNIVFVNEHVRSLWVSRYEKLHTTKLTNIVKRFEGRIDPRVVEQVLERYD